MLQPTALVNEAYIKLSGSDPVEWNDRGHFIAMAARAMRSVLVDHARARAVRSQTQVGEPSALDQIVVTYEDRAFDLLALDLALDRLADFDPRMARAVELRFFGGLSVDEVAKVMGVAKRTLEREWAAARAWLFQELS
jgi:RNA polymerase sigma factor (TIGR02999 family)